MNNIKKTIIPNEMKKNIDEVLENQLFNANRYYAESNPEISRLMNEQIHQSPATFLLELKERWNWHNHFYEDLLEPAFKEIFCKNINELSPKEVVSLIEIYKTCCLVDETTLITSGAIKKNLQYQMNNINVDTEGISDSEAKFMLLTPPIDTFFAEYQIDHLTYIILIKTNSNKAIEYKKYLLEKYHAGDEMIFNGRYNKKFKNKEDYSIEELMNTINRLKISNDYKNKHFYFTLEHDDRKAFRDLILYDNVDEKFISSKLIGISGFLLRTNILNYLNDSNILKNNGYIYEYSNEIVINSLNTLLERRYQKMELNVKPYKQNDLTCSIACMLMVLEYYGVIPKANPLYEREYYQRYKSRYLDGTPFSAIAYHLAKNNLDTEIIHSDKNIFSNNESIMPTTVFNDSMNEYKGFLNSAKDKGAKVINGLDINTKIIREKLEEGKMVILAGTEHDYLHAILVCGYENDMFIVCDPLEKKKQLKTADELNKYMNTALGKWCITVSNKTNKKQQLMNNLPDYQNTALNKMHLDDKTLKR